MADRWLGWCANNERETLLRVLNNHDTRASLSFADSAYELRCRVQESREPVGAIVGLVDEGVSAVNVAAAIARDASAREVILVTRDASEELRTHARRAAIDYVLDANDVKPVAPSGKHPQRSSSISGQMPPAEAVSQQDDGFGFLPEPMFEDLDQPLPTMLILPTAGQDEEVRAHAPSMGAQEVSPFAPGGSPSPERRSSFVPPSADGMARPNPAPAFAPPAPAQPNPAQPNPAQPNPAQSAKPATLDSRIPRIEGPKPPSEWTAQDEQPQGPSLAIVPASQHSAQPIVASPEVRVPWEREGEQPTGTAPVLVLMSGRGGVGKTSLVATMATAAASWGMRVGLVDLDLSAGNLYAHFGMPTPPDLGLLAKYETPSPEDVMACGRDATELIRLWGACELPEMAETVMPRVEAVLNAVRASCDLVLVDTSVALTDAVAQAAQTCDRLVIVVDGRLGSSAAQRQLGALAVRLGVARTRIVRLANRCGPRGRGEPAINRADIGLETARPLRVLDGGVEVSECLGEGNPQELFDLGSKFADSSATALAILLSELGCLPQTSEAQEVLERQGDTGKRGFGHRRKAV